MSDEHFTVDGTLIEAWASDTHASTTDPDARLYRRSNHAESHLAYLGQRRLQPDPASDAAARRLRAATCLRFRCTTAPGGR
jgi:hypothetical protein